MSSAVVRIHPQAQDAPAIECAAGLATASVPRAVTDRTKIEPAATTRLLILQPTPFCHLACRYCYLPDRGNNARMRLETVRAAVRRLREDGLLGRTLTVLWHAGEPLAMPRRFYEAACELIDHEIGGAVEIEHAMQTSGVLITEAWCDWFARRRVRIGLSIDGPAALHDAQRPDRRGRPTHAAAMRAAQLLRQRHIDFHVIAVITRRSLADVNGFIDFFESLSPSALGCSFEEQEGVNRHSSLASVENECAEFLRRLAERITLPVREFDQALRQLLQPLPTHALDGRDWPDNAQVMPWAMVNVAHDGGYSTFSPELLGQPDAGAEGHLLGNVHLQGFRASEASPVFQRMWAAIRQGVDACSRQCRYFDHCGGGAPANKLYEHGSFATTETAYCRLAIQRPFDLVLNRMEASLGLRSPVQHFPDEVCNAAASLP